MHKLTLLLLTSGVAALAHGPRNSPVELARYSAVHYVSGSTGSDQQGDGTVRKPWASISHALAHTAPAAGSAPQAILVAAGVYKEATLQMKPQVELYGGYEPKTWTRDIVRHVTTLDGENARRIGIGADHARIDGFTITHGRVRGNGGAILCDGVSPVITNNRFVENGTLAPESWKPPIMHETANDGAAIATLNGAAPRIESNLFAQNTTQIGRGGAISCDHQASPRIADNVMVQNRAGLDDTARSSDGGAISIYDHSSPLVEGNVIAANTTFNKNDAGAIFVALWSSPRILGNLIVGNKSSDDAGAIFVGGQKHHYGTPLDPVLPADQFLVRMEGNVIIANENSPARNSGAMRITMQGRALLINNVVAKNPGGVKIQSSGAELRKNTLIDDVNVTNDSKASHELPGPVVLADNILRGKLSKEMEVTVSNCEACKVSTSDGWEGSGKIVRRDPAQFVTVLAVAGPRNVAGRAIRIGGFWTVIKEVQGGNIAVWGLVPEEATDVEIVPSYR